MSPTPFTKDFEGISLAAHNARHEDGGADELTAALDPRAYPMLSGTLAARPAAGTNGRFYWTTDEHILYRDNGTTWDKVAVADHPDLDGVTADQHHAQLHEVAHEVAGGDALVDGATVPADIAATGATGTGTKPPRIGHVHAHPSGLGTDLHHAQSHTHASHTSIGANDHHAAPAVEGSPNAILSYLILPGVEFTGISTFTIAANRIYYAPIRVPVALTVDQIIIEVVTLSAGAVRLGIYNADIYWQPTTLVSDAGTVDTGTAGVKAITGLSIPLPAGRYLLAVWSNATPELRMIYGGTRYAGYIDTLGANPVVNLMYVDSTYSTYPSSGTAWNATGNSSTAMRHFAFVRAWPT